MRLTAGGNILEYDGKNSTETPGLGKTKILVNSVISTPRWFDISNMYINTKLPSLDYMKIHVSLIPQEVMEEYNITWYLDVKGYSYVEIMVAIYRLIQSDYLDNQYLIKNLSPYG